MRKVLLLSFPLLFPLLLSTSNCAFKNRIIKEESIPSKQKEVNKEIKPSSKVEGKKGSLNKKTKKSSEKKEKIGIKLTREQELLIKNLIIPEEAKPNIWPVVGIVTSTFRKRHGRFHSGIDIAADYGTPIVATAPGKVIYVGYRHGYGYMVVIYHGYGYTTVYAHMSGTDVKQGDLVDRGRVIGFVGATGRATGPHLHYEVLKYGVRQNPMIYLP